MIADRGILMTQRLLAGFLHQSSEWSMVAQKMSLTYMYVMNNQNLGATITIDTHGT